MTLKNHTHLDAVVLPEVPALPSDHPAWDAMDESAKALITASLDVAQRSRSLALAYVELFRETEVLRAERDALLARLNDEPFTAH